MQYFSPTHAASAISSDCFYQTFFFSFDYQGYNIRDFFFFLFFFFFWNTKFQGCAAKQFQQWIFIIAGVPTNHVQEYLYSQ